MQTTVKAIRVTFTGPVGAATVNWKVWSNVKKINKTAFTGVAYPLAA